MRTVLELGDFVLAASDDPLKRDLELTCAKCAHHLCDAQDGDTLQTLADVARSHLRECVRKDHP